MPHTTLMVNAWLWFDCEVQLIIWKETITKYWKDIFHNILLLLLHPPLKGACQLTVWLVFSPPQFYSRVMPPFPQRRWPHLKKNTRHGTQRGAQKRKTWIWKPCVRAAKGKKGDFSVFVFFPWQPFSSLHCSSEGNTWRGLGGGGCREGMSSRYDGRANDEAELE